MSWGALFITHIRERGNHKHWSFWHGSCRPTYNFPDAVNFFFIFLRGTVPTNNSICVLLLSALFLCPCSAQGPPVQQSPPLSQPGRDISAAPIGDVDDRDRMARTMGKKLNRERQAAIRKDTDELVKLAQELKESVDKSNENLLAVDVIRKAEQIEKLARGVKDRMKGPN